MLRVHDSISGSGFLLHDVFLQVRHLQKLYSQLMSQILPVQVNGNPK